MLCDWHCHARDVNLLKGILSEQRQCNVCSDSNHRYRIHIGCGDTCDQIGSARTACRKTDPYFACGTVDTVFGYPGGSILNIYDELYKHSDEITHILTSVARQTPTLPVARA